MAPAPRSSHGSQAKAREREANSYGLPTLGRRLNEEAHSNERGNEQGLLFDEHSDSKSGHRAGRAICGQEEN